MTLNETDSAPLLLLPLWRLGFSAVSLWLNRCHFLWDFFRLSIFALRLWRLIDGSPFRIYVHVHLSLSLSLSLSFELYKSTTNWCGKKQANEGGLTVERHQWALYSNAESWSDRNLDIAPEMPIKCVCGGATWWRRSAMAGQCPSCSPLLYTCRRVRRIIAWSMKFIDCDKSRTLN